MYGKYEDSEYMRTQYLSFNRHVNIKQLLEKQIFVKFLYILFLLQELSEDMRYEDSGFLFF